MRGNRPVTDFAILTISVKIAEYLNTKYEYKKFQAVNIFKNTREIN
jgi:hypothetical protein